MSRPLLEVRDLAMHFAVARANILDTRRRVLKAVDGVDFDVAEGATLGLVGESGCGKSTTARLVLRLLEPTRGTVGFDGASVMDASPAELLRLRRKMQIVFQDPLSSLNPRMSVGTNMAEPLRFHGLGDARERRAKARELLEIVGLNQDDYDRYPHEFSGGQCQRVAIARALILRPKLVVFDEPVSALDVSIQAQILRLLIQLQSDFGLTYVFISHDLAVVRRISNRTAVMYLGKIVEIGASEALHKAPLHPYTQALLRAVPTPDPTVRRAEDLVGLEGDVPSPMNPPKGCRFHTRCPHRMPICSEREPELKEHAPGHRAACFLLER